MLQVVGTLLPVVIKAPVSDNLFCRPSTPNRNPLSSWAASIIHSNTTTHQPMVAEEVARDAATAHPPSLNGAFRYRVPLIRDEG